MKKLVALVLALLLGALTLASCGSSAVDISGARSLADLAGARISAQGGTFHEDALAQLPAGTRLDVLTGLGNGYNTTVSGDHPVLVGGGVGVPPLYGLCKALLAQGKHPAVVLGFNKAEEIFLAEEFRALGVEVHIATADGSVGTRGFVTDVLKALPYTYFYACGPLPMFKAMEAVVSTAGQYSMEERMGCSIQTKSGAKRVCKDGPVFPREEVFF